MANIGSIIVTVAWWVRPYLAGVAFFASITGLTPDMAKVEKTVRRGLRVRVG